MCQPISLYKIIKKVFLQLAHLTGLFGIAQKITAKRLRILCYHRFSDKDDAIWSPDMVVKSTTLQNRMQYLLTHNYSVISLESAFKQLPHNTLPKNPVVITIDDGWFSTLTIAHPILSKCGFPYTIYVTGYYAKTQLPLFNHVVKYLFWRAGDQCLDLQNLHLPIFEADSGFIPATNQNIQKIIEYGDNRLTSLERQKLIKTLCKYLGIDFDLILQSRFLSLLSSSELRFLSSEGVDIQLHSYRHRWPKDHQLALKELADDRAFLEPIVGNRLKHFCYPSGNWTVEQFPVLKTAGILSATTCDNGLNCKRTHPYALKRFLDHENVSQLEFEAELSGFLPIVRSLYFFFFKRQDQI